MKTPAFWYRPAGALAGLLAPAGSLYGLGGALRMWLTTPRRAGVPVLCIGNLVAGGAGKTPVAVSILQALTARGVAAHALTRGHGGAERGPLAVDPARHGAADVGDEALLLAEHAPTWVARDRAAGARAAAAAGAQAIVMDDGFQNPALAKDLSLLVVDGATGFGNGRLVPAGPLREPVARGLARADAVVVMGDDRAGVAARVAPLPVLRARIEADEAELAGRRVLAFAGIGRPEKFFDTLRALGAGVAEAHPFADHHPYREDEVRRLLARAEALAAEPVTTAKDAVRLPTALRDRVRVLPVRAAWDDPAALDTLLDRLVAKGGRRGEAA
ncbi:tetraacyldisaccharide 4'-kinase [Azospirillum sp. TSO22-1]|uniref:tetraacyldisaccharide 4'-kinase n=1 Tax=Azospirillum sp. TSO22-1 TaxID=716789 RepID=UPI000D60D8C0|nr:tetraacyldisaccharide 4'-kinase [Azospirillum sp. TSO22-1]PWC40687.1 tetraacyldisaccharide 4'-kinase [Azospirillum sp. TSO22-1]